VASPMDAKIFKKRKKNLIQKGKEKGISNNEQKGGLRGKMALHAAR